MLQANTTLTPANWLTVTDSATVTNGENQLLISPTNSQKFYRLVNP